MEAWKIWVLDGARSARLEQDKVAEWWLDRSCQIGNSISDS
jgi:hypothetical protein